MHLQDIFQLMISFDFWLNKKCCRLHLQYKAQYKSIYNLKAYLKLRMGKIGLILDEHIEKKYETSILYWQKYIKRDEKLTNCYGNYYVEYLQWQYLLSGSSSIGLHYIKIKIEIAVLSICT